MQLQAFEEMVRGMAREVPASYFDGITEVVVSPRAVAHPTRDEIYTLGECIPLGIDAEGADAVQSRVVLYHGSFAALATLDPAFDWEAEAWETLTHELRHHVEWRAQRATLEHYDAAAEANFARHDGEAFDPLFFHEGLRVDPDVYEVDDDVFVDMVVADVPDPIVFTWRGRKYRAAPPAGMTLPAYLEVGGLSDPPVGDLVLVVRHKVRFRDFFRHPTVFRAAIEADMVMEG